MHTVTIYYVCMQLYAYVTHMLRIRNGDMRTHKGLTIQRQQKTSYFLSEKGLISHEPSSLILRKKKNVVCEILEWVFFGVNCRTHNIPSQLYMSRHFVCVNVLRPSQTNGVVSSAVYMSRHAKRGGRVKGR